MDRSVTVVAIERPVDGEIAAFDQLEFERDEGGSARRDRPRGSSMTWTWCPHVELAAAA
jgi:hypothetical protein